LVAPDTHLERQPIPILLYHSVSAAPSSHIAAFAVPPDTFRRHLACIVERGRTPLTVSEFVAFAQGADAGLPERPIVVTFDDGYADFAEEALPALREHGIRATLYVTTGFLSNGQHRRAVREPPGVMLPWSELNALIAEGVEIGAHTHTHPQLDTLRPRDASVEISRSKALLEDALDHEIASFAYPHGYSSPRVRSLVREAGYASACSVKNAFSSWSDDRFAVARLMVRRTTPLERVAQWIEGAGAPVARADEALRTRAWRVVRRARAVAHASRARY